MYNHLQKSIESKLSFDLIDFRMNLRHSGSFSKRTKLTGSRTPNSLKQSMPKREPLGKFARIANMLFDMSITTVIKLLRRWKSIWGSVDCTSNIDAKLDSMTLTMKTSNAALTLRTCLSTSLMFQGFQRVEWWHLRNWMNKLSSSFSKLIKQVLRIIVAGNLSFSFVENPEFVVLLQHAYPSCNYPNRRSVAKALKKNAKAEKISLKEELAQNDSKISLALDGWTSSNNMAFLGMSPESQELQPLNIDLHTSCDFRKYLLTFV